MLNEKSGQTIREILSPSDHEMSLLRKSYGKLHKLVVDGNLLVERINGPGKPDRTWVEQTRSFLYLASEKLTANDLNLLFDFEGGQATARNCVACREVLLSALKRLEKAVVLDALTGFAHHSLAWVDGIQPAIMTLSGSLAPAQENPRLRDWLSETVSLFLSNPTSYYWNDEGEFAKTSQTELVVSPENKDEPLTDRESWVLQALIRQNAIDPDRRMSTASIARNAGGKTADENAYKSVIIRLKRCGIVKTKRGRGGGVWLTAQGQARARK
jgi:hypothetical protein